jgi:hypothetical protein
MKLRTLIPLLLLATVLFMVVALYNGYPLVEGDTGAYLERGILGGIPPDRSPFYSWFVRYTAMWTSLWFPIVVQSFVISWLLYKYIRYFASISLDGMRMGGAVNAGRGYDAGSGVLNLPAFFVFNTVIVVAFTCAIWVTPYLMPDVFTAALMLATLLFLIVPPGKTGSVVGFAVLLYALLILHNSHFPIMVVFAGLATLWALVQRNRVLLKRSLIMIGLSCLSWVTICAINYGNGYDFTFSRAGHVFIMARLAETGTLSEYLSANCATKNYKICQYQGVIPDYSWDFLWKPESPLYQTGGWDTNKVEYNNIIHEVFTTPRYLSLFARKTALGTLREFTSMSVQEKALPQEPLSLTWRTVEQFYKDEYNEFAFSRQEKERLFANWNNYLYYIFFVVSTLWVLCFASSLPRQIRQLYGYVLLFLLANAFITRNKIIYPYIRCKWLLRTRA